MSGVKRSRPTRVDFQLLEFEGEQITRCKIDRSDGFLVVDTPGGRLVVEPYDIQAYRKRQGDETPGLFEERPQ